jgi:hypothetical protein
MLYRIKALFHVRRKPYINDIGEPVFHISGQHFAQRGGAQVFILAEHIFPVCDGG